MLSEDHADKVRLTLATAGWREVMLPAMSAWLEQARDVLEVPAGQRREPFAGTADDDLRATIRCLRKLLTLWPEELRIHDHNRRRDELDRQDGAAANPQGADFTSAPANP